MAYIWGRQAVREAFRAGHGISKVYVAAGAKPSGALGEILAAARERGIPVQPVTNAVLDRLAAGGNHQGVAAEAAEFEYAYLEDLLARSAARGEPALLLVLDHLTDPQNVGTLLRTAEAVGVHGVIMPRERAVGITPAVLKASAGAAAHLPIAQEVNLPRTIEALKESGLWVIGLDANALEMYDAVDYSTPLALVVGSEGRGLSRLVREKCDLLVKLPMRGKIESLNAAVAGSIVLYEIWRRRRGLAAG